MRKASDDFAGLPDRELVFFWQGANYLHKMGCDLAFLPLPSSMDPLLAYWFDRHVEWLLTSPASPLKADALPDWDINLTSSLADEIFSTPKEAPPELDGLEPHEQRNAMRNFVGLQMARGRATSAVTRTLVGERERHEGPDGPARVLRTALRRVKSENAAERWRWGGFQILLYGGECYVSLLRALPQCLDHFEEHKAATMLQNAYRQRTARLVMQVKRTLVAEKRQLEWREQQLIWNRAALRIQRHVRGAIIRQAIYHCVGYMTVT